MAFLLLSVNLIASLLKFVITEIVSCNLLFYENNIFNLSININYVIDIGVCIILSSSFTDKNERTSSCLYFF